MPKYYQRGYQCFDTRFPYLVQRLILNVLCHFNNCHQVNSEVNLENLKVSSTSDVWEANICFFYASLLIPIQSSIQIHPNPPILITGLLLWPGHWQQQHHVLLHQAPLQLLRHPGHPTATAWWEGAFHHGGEGWRAEDKHLLSDQYAGLHQLYGAYEWLQTTALWPGKCFSEFVFCITRVC